MLKELIIKVDNRNIHLSPKLVVPILQTNFPINHCKFRTQEEIYWKVELIEYNIDNKCLKMKVINYRINDIKNFERQSSSKEIERIAFEKFDWLQLERQLSNYQKSKLLDILENHNTDKFFREETKKVVSPINIEIPKPIVKEYKQQKPLENVLSDPPEKTPVIKTYREEFSVYFSEANFKLGYVTFSKFIKEVNAKVDFKIKNDYILEEFDTIKSWFAKKLKTKKFNVIAVISTVNGKVTDVVSSSKQIAMINAELIESIRYQRTIALTKTPIISDSNKSLFTADEIFDTLETEDIEGNVFNQNEQNVLKFLLEKYKTRNKKQLEYLAGNKQVQNNKLRFTLHPNFGFLFFIEGKDNNHFVWELLNSHATYIWSIEKSEQEIELQYKRIEASINSIRDHGREKYKRSYKQNHIDNDLVFFVMNHDDISSNFTDGFIKWKHKLNERLT